VLTRLVPMGYYGTRDSTATVTGTVEQWRVTFFSSGAAPVPSDAARVQQSTSPSSGNVTCAVTDITYIDDETVIIWQQNGA
jgi:hypothetical protein